MTITNVTLNDTFAEWVTKTNQLISQYGETNQLAVSAYDTTNAASFTAANISAEILSTNNTFILNISNELVSSGNLMNAILGNVYVQNVIYTNTNAIASAFNSNSNLNFAWLQANTANITADLAYGTANSANLTAVLSYGNAANAIINAGLAFNKANVANVTADLAYGQANTARDQANNAKNLLLDTVNATRYIMFSNGTSGNISSLNVASGLTFNPSSNLLSVAGSVSDSKGDVRVIVTDEKAAAYGLVKNDVGKTITISTSSNVYVPNAVFTAGDAVTLYNNSSATMNIVSNSSITMYIAGTSTTGNRTLQQRGVATILCVYANNFVITGAGLS